MVSLVLLVLAGCAFEVAPRGGPKDSEAPVLLNSLPKDSSINFKGNHLKFQFDEFIALSNPKDNVLFSPPVKRVKEFYVSGKIMHVLLDDTLRADRTYEVTLANAVKDINEGNILKGEQISFSTGDLRDSLGLSGVVMDYKTNLPVEGLKVTLFEADCDSCFFSVLPLYVSITDKEGVFNFGNLKRGSYQVYVLKDLNYNLNFDSPKESVGFLDSVVLVDSCKMDTLKLLSFNNIDSNYFFSKIKKRFGGKAFYCSKVIDSLEVNALVQGVDYSVDWDGADSFRIWQNVELADTISYEIRVNGGKLVDTVTLFFPKMDSTDLRSVKKYSKTLSAEVKGVKPIILFDQLIYFDFNFSIDSVVWDSIIVKENDSLIYCNAYLDSSTRRRVVFDYDWKEKKSYSIFCRDSIFWDRRDSTADTLFVTGKTRPYKSFGKVEFIIVDSLQRSLIVELIKGKDVFKEYYVSGDSSSIVELYLQPGQYSLRFVYDRNGDHKWTTGNIHKRIQPERSYLYEVPINIKGGFDLIQEINLSHQKF